ncbi:peptide chain release factor PrfB1, chloroplastic isoform X1 [Camellia sinensis]|uniref:peptide chain release factor PrfB1, chloroplastic isoform X1 n=1 Tax=Camellia sinensis TaxID=4442 RepID=UPI0010356DB6|nr:peptide chain release factor PrfB1, chloroplastic isoform X1 [Camellia sinensis]
MAQTMEGLVQGLTAPCNHLLRPLYCSTTTTTTTTILVSPKSRRLPLSLHNPPNPTSSLHSLQPPFSSPPLAFGLSTPTLPPFRFTSTVLLATPESQVSVGDSAETSEWAMQDFYSLRKDVENTSKRVEEIRASAGLKQLEEDLADLERAAADSSFWDDRIRAQQTLLSLNDVKDKIKLLTEFENQIEDAETIVKLTEEMESVDGALFEEAANIVGELNKALDRYELTQLLSGPYDKEGAVIYITAGAGGTDAQDWADMLLRMYVRWGEKQRYKTKVVEKSLGEEAGIKSATIEIEGRYAYGYISGEKGTHRIVRQSPFNSKGLRQTSFSGVEVMPLLPDESLDVEIPEEELEISFSRAGGKGGQNVNKVETAVRITHIPTGVTLRCTEERSQLANKIKALSRLKAKLLVIAEEQRASEIKQIRGDVVKAEWGQQIRNYVFHPYKLVKDVRTGFETSDIVSVMDGDLDPFIKTYLKYKYKEAMSAIGKDRDKMTTNT